MLTCIDKLYFKRQEKIEFTKSEKYFIGDKNFRKLLYYEIKDYKKTNPKSGKPTLSVRHGFSPNGVNRSD